MYLKAENLNKVVYQIGYQYIGRYLLSIIDY